MVNGTWNKWKLNTIFEKMYLKAYCWNWRQKEFCDYEWKCGIKRTTRMTFRVLLFKMFRPHICILLWTVVYLAILGLQIIWSQHKYLFNQWLTYVYAVIFMSHRISLYFITQQFSTNWVIKTNLIFFFNLCHLICYLLTILSKI